MKIIIPGGTGQVGIVLARAFQKEGHEVVVLSRNPQPVPWKAVNWDAENVGDWVSEFEGADIVINLAGRSVNCRYTQHNRNTIKDSRIKSTAIVGKAIGLAKSPPPLWLQMSTATIYAHRYDVPNDEYTGIIGGKEKDVPDTWNFSIDVATSWERTLDESITPHTRKVALRSAMVMSPDRGGIFDTILNLVRFGLGGAAGDGKQYISWIHEADFIRAILHIIENQNIDGAINLASPNPLPNAEFMKKIRDAWGIPIGLPSFEWMLEIGAVFLQTETELILKSRRVVPTRLLESGFTFQYAEWDDAVVELCRRSRNLT